MKKTLIALALTGIMVAATGCGNSKLTEEQERTHRLDDSLQVALANADSLFSLLYDVTMGLEQISHLEHLLNSDINPESTDARMNIQKQMAAIQKGLIERRERIEELEKRLGQGAGENSKLRRQLDALREQIDGQAATVADLTARLENAHIRIDQLTDSIGGLTASVDSIAAAEAQVKGQLDKAVEDLNSVYYVIGSNDELRKHNFLSGGGFLRKTKVLEADFDESYMTRGDRRTLTVIPLDAKKAEVKTKQPEDSYKIDKSANGILSLRITDPKRFWGVSNILVIETKD